MATAKVKVAPKKELRWRRVATGKYHHETLGRVVHRTTGWFCYKKGIRKAFSGPHASCAKATAAASVG